MVEHKATVDILFIPTSLAFLPYNVTAHGLVLILFLCYVVALITVLVLVIDIVVQLINTCMKDKFPINLFSNSSFGIFLFLISYN